MQQSFEQTLQIAKLNQDKSFYIREIALLLDGKRAFALESNTASSYFNYIFSLSNKTTSILKLTFTSALDTYLRSWVPNSSSRRISEILDILNLIKNFKPKYGIITGLEIVSLLDKKFLIPDLKEEDRQALIKESIISLGTYFPYIVSIKTTKRASFFETYLQLLEKNKYNSNKELSAVSLTRLIQHEVITSLNSELTAYLFRRENTTILEILIKYLLDNEKFQILEYLLFQSFNYNMHLHKLFNFITECGGKISLAEPSLLITNLDGRVFEIQKADFRFWSETKDYLFSIQLTSEESDIKDAIKRMLFN